ncbi:MAG: YvcK family protein [Chloroflexi bacterium]|nr:YvcK family protein [Chloroflexota bacterium]
MDFLKWLYPGMHIKRWLALLMVGIVIIALGFAYILRQIYNTYTFPDFVWYITLQFIPRYYRGALFAVVGVAAIVIAGWRFYRSLVSALLPNGRDDSLVNILYQHHHLRRGPKIVAIGGGTGLSTLLRGLREYSGNLSAIVTVADDGGSSGRLRRELGVLPPGDFRNCIAALADVEPLMTKLLQYRFSEGSGLEGHSFGNLFIVAMSGVTGSFEQAVRESSRVLAVRGQILPSTLANVVLSAKMEDEITVYGESKITESNNRIRQLFLEPADAAAYPEAVKAIEEADLLVLGPGSLYTSILPNLLVDGIKRAVAASKAMKVYVCNVATQRGETDGFSVANHVEALTRHVGEGLFQYVLVNNNILKLPKEWRVVPVSLDWWPVDGIQLVAADLVNKDLRLRHDQSKLGAALLQLYYSNGRSQRRRWLPQEFSR